MRLLSFLGDRRGNVAVIFAVALVPLMGFVGAAVEYSRANNQTSRVQAAVDATVINLAKLPSSTSDADLQTKGDAEVRSMLVGQPVSTNLNVTVTRSGSSITAVASSNVSTSIINVIGIRNFPVSATSTAIWGNTRLRVALVLDVTGSMASDNKLTSMQTAATNLLTQLQGSATNNGDVYVSIVPFAKDVNVGASNYYQNWVKFSGADDTWEENNGSCSQYTHSTKADCVSHGRCSSYPNNDVTQSSCTSRGTCSDNSYSSQSTCTSHGDCSIGSYSTQSSCTAATGCTVSGNYSQNSCTSDGTCSNTYYTSRTSCQNRGYTWTAGVWGRGVWTADAWTPYTWTAYTWTPGSHANWNGCVMDRDQNYDTTNTAPSSSDAATQFPAEQYSTCPAQIMALSYDWTALSSKINSLAANGGTNQQIGLAWGYQSLTGSPMSVPALDPSYSYNQTIILLSDGLNTQNRWYGNGHDWSSQVDDRQKILCDNIKASKITIYAVQVNTTGDPTSSVLQYCASGTDKFFQLTSANQIVTTFNQIGTALSGLRLSQ